MQHLKDRVALITGAGRGIGREHALLFASEGAQVVVNDLGGATDGTGSAGSAAQEVVDEIVALGGQAVANSDSVSDWEGARRMVDQAVEAFGRLDVVVNNAGILRDRMLVKMEEADWDAVMNVHLKGTFCVTRHAAAHWRERFKSGGEPVDAAVILTGSGSGLMNGIAQSNYGAAKAGIATFGQIAAKELEHYGVRVNTIAPVARTRLTALNADIDDELGPPAEEGAFDPFAAGNVSPLVAYLASSACRHTGGVWNVQGGKVGLFEGWHEIGSVQQASRWTVAELGARIDDLVAERGRTNDKLLSEGQPFSGWETTLAASPPGSREGVTEPANGVNL